jgi:hypothetical protein
MEDGDRLLLYIDILGFAEMTKREPRKVARVYSILDQLNVHGHNSFKTIVFSDTILVYNPILAINDKDRSYFVWYLIEFAEDLQHRLIGQDIFFRAILTAGSFDHYRLKNVECFFGEALVDAYSKEKGVPSIGLFIDNYCNKFNRYFRYARFDEELSFVYLNRSIESLNEYSGGVYPVKDYSVIDEAPHTPWQVRFLSDVYRNMREHKSPKVRTKYLTAWDYYAKRYPGMLQLLANTGFSLTSLVSNKAWKDVIEQMDNGIKYYKRIGSGTPMSMRLTKSGHKKE